MTRKRGAVLALALLIALLAVLLSRRLEPIFFRTADNPQPHLGVRAHIATWLYACLLIGTFAALGLPRSFFARLHGTAGRLSRFSLPQGPAAWLLALAASGLVSALAVFGAGVGVPAPEAVWCKVVVTDAHGQAPDALLRHGPNAEDTTPVRWQPYPTTLVAVQPAATLQEPVRVTKVRVDGMALSLDRVGTAGAIQSAPAEKVIAPGGSLLRWDSLSRQVEITFAPGAGDVKVIWLDRAVTVTLGREPSRALLQMPGDFQGWALLPPRTIHQLSLELHDANRPCTVRSVEVFGPSPQRWSDLVPEQYEGSARAFALAGLQPLNPPHWRRSLALMVLLSALLFAVLAALRLAAVLMRRPTLAFEFRENAVGVWLGRTGERLTLPRAVAIAWVAAGTFQLCYACTVPVGWTNDASAYWQIADSFRAGAGLTDMPFRTPGYPFFLLLVRQVLGDSALCLLVVQHLLLALLAPLTVSVLARRLPLPVALAAGVCAGLSPVISSFGNLPLTEVPFTVLTTAALLVYAGWGRNWRGLLCAGVLIGAATMVRTNGVMLLPLLVLALLVSAWCCLDDPVRRRLALTGPVLLGCGYFAVAGPWHLHMAVARGTLDFSRGHVVLTAWCSAIWHNEFSDTLPINRPQRAVWAVPAAWSSDPFQVRDFGPEMSADAYRYYAEFLRQGRAACAGRHRQVVLASLRYNTLLRHNEAVPHLVFHPEIDQWLGYFRAPAATVVPDVSVTSPTFVAQVAQSYATPSRARRLCLATSTWFLQRWCWWAVLGLAALLPLLLCRALHIFLPAWLYWVGLIATYSWGEMPTQRYVAVIEPLLYVLGILFIYALMCLRPRRVAQKES